MAGAILLILLVLLLAAGVWIYQYYNLILTNAAKKLASIKEDIEKQETTKDLNLLFDELQKINEIKLIHSKVKDEVQVIYELYKDKYTSLMKLKGY